MINHRKMVRRGHEPGDCHEFTFSCYRQFPLLTDDDRLRMLSIAVDRAAMGHGFRFIAFVFMPEHVHLLAYPTTQTPRIDLFLKAIKRPFSIRVKQDLIASESELLDTLTVRERPGVQSFRFWQEGGGYDRNLRTDAATLAAIDDIHRNPVRRGLCDRTVDWKWSSARHDADTEVVDPELPVIHGLPRDFFTSIGR